MDRRSFIRSAGIGMVLLSGCSSDSDSSATEQNIQFSKKWEYSELSEDARFVAGSSTSDTIYILQSNGYFYNINRQNGERRWFEQIDAAPRSELFTLNEQPIIAELGGLWGEVNIYIYTSEGELQTTILPEERIETSRPIAK
ncbi:hypothetical protein [Halorhabdus sp. CBA1104]|uniref:hypothetical protein n=1 Tax=Halorhabdus sp. CBA1104 TaxID=1380432 RepID=UPI0012B2AEDC|nr:hypothetical protein [Halorhabdus sp. CBA1104]